MKTHSENVRVLTALTDLLLSHLAEVRRLQADSQGAAGPVAELLHQVAGRTEQTANQVKERLSRALAAEGYSPAMAAAGDGQLPRGADPGPRIRGFS
jgi:hypothetical protein